MFNRQRKAICVLQKRPSGHTNLCVSAGGPWGDGMCGRTCHSRGSPWERSPGCAHDAGAETAEWSPSPSPLLHRRLQRIRGGRDQWKCFECQFQGDPHTQTSQLTQLKFFFPSSVCLLLSLFFFLTQMCQRYTKSNASNGFKRWADRMLTFNKLFYRNTTVLRYTLNSNTLKTTNAFPLSSCFFSSFFYPSYHHSHYAYAGLQWNKKRNNAK